MYHEINKLPSIKNKVVMKAAMLTSLQRNLTSGNTLNTNNMTVNTAIKEVKLLVISNNILGVLPIVFSSLSKNNANTESSNKETNRINPKEMIIPKDKNRLIKNLINPFLGVATTSHTLFKASCKEIKIVVAEKSRVLTPIIVPMVKSPDSSIRVIIFSTV